MNWNEAYTGYHMNEAVDTNTIKPTMTAQSLTANDAQQEAMEFNRKEAEKNRKWQEMMYGSRFQRTMEDIKKAGLNPYILNMFSPGGFGSGGAATIAANVMKNYSQSHNTNKREATPFDWASSLIPLIGGGIGAIFGGSGAVIGSALGQLTARALKMKK